MSRHSLTVIILTYNEEKHILRAINSVKNIASAIIVVDSYSSDDTIKIAETAGAEVFQNSWVNHAVQFQWALDNLDIGTQWIMRLDADEFLETKDEKNISKLYQMSGGITGVNIRRKIFFMDQWIRHGAIYPVYSLRIWKNGSGRMENRWMDEHIVLTNGVSTKLDIDIVDDNKNSVTWWIDKHNSYATKEAIEVLNQKYNFLPFDEALKNTSGSPAKIKRYIKNNIYNKLPFFFRPFIYFLYRYFLRLGFLDGRKGFAFHFMQAYWYRSLVDLKVIELEGLLNKDHSSNDVKALLSNYTDLKL